MFPRAFPFYFENAGITCYLSVATSSQLKEWEKKGRLIVEYVEVTESKKGKQIRRYQRSQEPLRVNKIIKFLKQKSKDSIIPSILPQSVVLNVRKEFKARGQGDHCSLPRNLRFHVVDGQHRVEALLKVQEEIPLPITIVSGLNELQEAGLFLLINHTQKRVPATIRLLDIAAMLRSSGRTKIDLRPLLEIMGLRDEGRRVLEIAADQAMERNHFWFDKIKLPSSEEI